MGLDNLFKRKKLDADETPAPAQQALLKVQRQQLVKRLRRFRKVFFKTFGEERRSRVLVIYIFISDIWLLADLVSGSYNYNLLRELSFLLMAVIVERLLIWGK